MKERKKRDVQKHASAKYEVRKNWKGNNEKFRKISKKSKRIKFFIMNCKVFQATDTLAARLAAEALGNELANKTPHPPIPSRSSKSV